MGSKLYNIEFGTFVTKSNNITISVSKDLFKLRHLNELRHTVEQLHQEASFLDIEAINESESAFVFTFGVDTNEYRNLKNIKNENVAVRFAVTCSILEQNIAGAFSGYVSLYPANIWYKPLSDIKYAYRGSYEMPMQDSEPNLVRYKALALYILIGYPFEKALNQEYKISESKYPYAVQIINAQTITELVSLLNRKRDEIIYQNIQRHRSTNGKARMVIAAAFIALLLIDAIVLGLAKRNLRVNADESLQAQLTTVTAELEDTKSEATSLTHELSLNNAIAEGNYEEVGILMASGGSDNEEIASLMFQKNQYNLALKYNANLLEQIIQAIYDSGDTERIGYLVLDSDNETLVQKLRIENAIISYDTTVLDSEWALSGDRHTLTRVAEAYVSHGEAETAMTILKKLESSQFSEEYLYLEALLKLAEDDSALQVAQSTFDEISALPDDDENKSAQLQEAETQVNTYKESINADTTELQSAAALLEEAWANAEG